MSDLFISHSSHDNAAAQALQAQLAAQGHRSVFLDFDPQAGIQAGVSWERTLYTKLRACRAVVALCSDHYLASQWCFAEIALARMEGKEIFVLQIAPWSDSTQLPSILQVEQTIDLRSQPALAYQRLWNGLQQKGIVASEARDWRPDEPPYPGLRAFREQDAAIFFGRDEVLREGLELLNRVRRLGHPRLMMVLGSSGSGKSSLVLAGMLPALRRDRQQWRLVPPLRPGQDPLQALALAFSRAFDEAGQALDADTIQRSLVPTTAGAAQEAAAEPADAGSVAAARQRLLQALQVVEPALGAADVQVLQALRHLRDYLAQPLASASSPPPATLPPAAQPLADLAARLQRQGGETQASIVLVIDQFEELLGHAAAHPASQFLALLRGALEQAHSPLLVIATMRSDYLDSFQRCTPLLGLGFQSLSVGPMTVDGMRQVIEEPARLGQIMLEKGLPDLLLHDTDTPDALPLLAFTLRLMWERYRGDRLLAIDEYRALGGLQGAIAQVAEETYEAVLARDKRDPTALAKALRDAFLSMARPAGDGVGWARQPVAWDRLPDQVQPALAPFIDPQRLLVKRPDGTVEVAHEALFRSWGRLRRWLDDNTESLHLLREIHDQARAWQQAGSDAEREPYLLRGGRLVRALDLRREGTLPLPDLALAFIDASDSAERAQAEARERRRRRALRRTQLFAAVLGLAFLVAAWAWREAEQQRSAAERQRRLALTQVHKKDPVLGRLVSREVPGRPAGWTAIAADQAVYRVPQIHQLGRGLVADTVAAVAFGPDGGFVTANAAHELWLWAPVPGQGLQPQLLGSHGVMLWDVALSQAGHTVASADNDGVVKLWDARQRAPAPPLHSLQPAAPGQALRVRLSQDGQVVAVLAEAGEDGPRSVTVWRLDGGTPRSERVPVRRHRGADDAETALALSPDGSRLLIGHRSGAVVLRVVQRGFPLDRQQPAAHAEQVRQLAFGDSAAEWASADDAGQLRWRRPAGPDGVLEGGETGVQSPLALRLAQGRVFMASESTVFVRNLAGSVDPSHAYFPEFFHQSIRDADFDGQRVLTALEGRDGASVWDIARATEPQRLVVAPAGCADDQARALAYLGDDRLLVAYAGGTLRLWSALDPDRPAGSPGPQAQLLAGPAPGAGCAAAGAAPVQSAARLTALATSADGQRYAMAFQDGRITVGQVGMAGQSPAPTLVPPAPPPPPLEAVRAGGETCLPPVAPGEPDPGDSQQAVWSLAFGPDGRSLVVGRQDGRVLLLALDSQRWTAVGRHAGAVCRVDWARRGDRLLSASLDQQVRIWPLAAGRPAGAPGVLPHPGAVYSAAFSADGQQVASGAADFLLRVWALGPTPASKRELPGHYSSVRDAAFSRDGRWLLSGAGNQLGLSCLAVPGPGPGAPAPCEADQMLKMATPHQESRVGAVRALAVAPTRPQFAVVDAAGELNLFRTDHRTALWRQQPVCMAEAQRQTALRETAAQAEAGARQCRQVVAACQRSAADCELALADAALR
ncbi:MAG: TIR domain-containing protein [Pseudomonadota bacterium]